MLVASAARARCTAPRSGASSPPATSAPTGAPTMTATSRPSIPTMSKMQLVGFMADFKHSKAICEEILRRLATGEHAAHWPNGGVQRAGATGVRRPRGTSSRFGGGMADA
jgi:hypothetical protein